MFMKRSVLVILLIYLISPFPDAQQLWKLKRWEAVTGLGPTFFFGDVGGYSKTKNILGIRDFSLMQTRFDLNFNLKYRITQDLNARLSLAYGFLHATDERGSNEPRGYDAAISFFEPSIIGEYYFIKNSAESSYLFSKGKGVNGIGGIFKSLDFYVLTGIGGLSYSIKGNDKLLEQDIDPGGFTAIIPVGLGSTLVYSPDFNFGVEFAGRYSFSDNLDGYTSQYSSSNDVYYFFNFTITYKLKTGANGLPTFR